MLLRPGLFLPSARAGPLVQGSGPLEVRMTPVNAAAQGIARPELQAGLAYVNNTRKTRSRADLLEHEQCTGSVSDDFFCRSNRPHTLLQRLLKAQTQSIRLLLHIFTYLVLIIL